MSEDRLRVGLPGVDAHLGDLEVPVAEVVPHEVIERVGELVEPIGFDGGVGVADGGGQAGEYPPVGEVILRIDLAPRGHPLQVHQREARGVPELVAEVSPDVELGGGVGLSPVGERHLLDRHADVLGLGGHGGEGESQGVGPVGVDDVQRVDPVAQALGHLAALSVLDHGVDEHVAEGGGVEAVLAHHDHAGDPEGDDLTGGDQGVARVEGLQLRRLIRPSHRTERPQCR